MREINFITGNRFFTGPSDQEKAAKDQMAQLSGFQSDLKTGKYNVANRFDNYEDPFGLGEMESQLDDIFSGFEGKINRGVADATKEQQQTAAESMASRGITGGSVLTDTQSKIASDLNKTKTDALADLGIGKSNSMLGLMEGQNRNNLLKTRLASDVDFGNVRNVLSSLLSSYGGQQNLISAYDNGGGFDDIFSILEMAASVASLIPTGGTSAVAASDRRLKTNIQKIGEVGGINIYEFNYVWDNNRRYRGVMADEVPSAAIERNGYLFVDYSKLPGIEFTEV